MEDLSRSLNEVGDSVRNNERNDSKGTNEESLNKHITMRFMIMNAVAGGLIGKGGERIKGLNEKYKIHISIPMTQAMVRVVIISGKRSGVVNSLHDIIPLMKQPPIHVYNKEFELNLLISDALAPIIIGTRGSRIQSIRKESNVSVKVYDQNIPESDERLIVMGGEISNMISAINTILNHSDNIKHRKDMYYADFNRVTIEDILDYCDGRQRSHGRPSHNFISDNPPQRAFQDPYRLPPPSNLPTKTIQVSVPHKQIGVIAGKRCANIHKIESITGCKIQIDGERNNPDCPFRILSLTGNEKQINDAEYYLQETIRDAERGSRMKGPR